MQEKPVPFKVGIIGAGRIASGFDEPGGVRILTHAHAVSRQPGLALTGFYDIDPKVSRSAAAKWGGIPFESLNALLAEASDLVIIAVPDPFHEICLNAVAERAPRLVICEKPLTHDLPSARAIVRLFSDRSIPLLVNYQRRFDTDVIELARRIRHGELGRPLGGTLLYSKGTKHNGSHAIDLLRYLFGEPTKLQAFDRVIDFDTEDPTVSGRIEFPSIAVNLQAADERKFSIFEIDLLFEGGRYRFTHSGLDVEISLPKPDPVFAGYCELAVIQYRSTGLSDALTNLMASAVSYLAGGVSPSNTAADALATQEVCVRLIDLASRITEQN
jgi:predicted dehydrogenase